MVIIESKSKNLLKKSISNLLIHMKHNQYKSETLILKPFRNIFFIKRPCMKINTLISL